VGDVLTVQLPQTHSDVVQDSQGPSDIKVLDGVQMRANVAIGLLEDQVVDRWRMRLSRSS